MESYGYHLSIRFCLNSTSCGKRRVAGLEETMPGYFMRTVAMAISLLVIVGCSTERESVERQLGVRLLSDSEIPKGFETYTFIYL